MCIKKLFFISCFFSFPFFSFPALAEESPTTEVVTGTADITEGSGFEEISRIAYSAHEVSRVDSKGGKAVLDSWINAFYSGPAANRAGSFFKRVLEVGSPAGEYGTFRGFWSAGTVCIEKNSAGICLRHALLFGAWAQDETGKATAGIFSRDSINHSVRLIIPAKTERLDSKEYAWSVYDPKGILVDFWYRSSNGTIQVDTQFLVLASGTCGPREEDAVPCMVASVEYRQGTTKELFLVAKEGMPELEGGKLERLWNSAFYGGIPVNRGVNELREAVIVFTAVFTDEQGNKKERLFVSSLGFYQGGPSIYPLLAEAAQ